MSSRTAVVQQLTQGKGNVKFFTLDPDEAHSCYIQAAVTFTVTQEDSGRLASLYISIHDPFPSMFFSLHHDSGSGFSIYFYIENYGERARLCGLSHDKGSSSGSDENLKP